jgi:hypothetical protein
VFVLWTDDSALKLGMFMFYLLPIFKHSDRNTATFW